MRRTRLATMLGVVAAAAVLAAACSSSGNHSSSGTTGGLSNVSVALDFVPNADNSGVFVAEKLGYFKDAGLHVKVVPYGQTPPDTLVSSGRVNFAIADDLADTMFDVASGDKVKSVFAVLQHEPSVFGVLSKSSIKSPKDFCGKTYGGFGYPADPALIQAMIKGAGGPASCNVKSVTLGSSAYQAVASNRVDFSAFFFSDLIEAETKYHASFRAFAPKDYGVPDQYGALFLGNSPWLSGHAKQASAFVGAIQRAYIYIEKHPDQGAAILQEMNPTAVEKAPATKSSEVMAKHFLAGPGGQVGVQTAAMWNNFGRFLYKAGVFVDSQGHKLSSEPDWSQYWTNQYLPKGGGGTQ